MMELLVLAWLVFVVVLVVALVGSLTAIWYRLHRLARALREVDDALRQVNAGTEPLEELLSPLEQGTRAAADELGAAHASAESAERRARESADSRRGVPMAG